MPQILTPQQLTLDIDAKQFGFADTSELIAKNHNDAQYQAWVAQAEAKKAAEFGLNIQHAGFNLLALGEPGSGRTTLMLSVMHESAGKLPAASDLLALYLFESNGKPLFLKLPAGAGTQLKQALDVFVRNFAKDLSTLLEAKIQQASIDPVKIYIESQLATVKASLTLMNAEQMPVHYFNALKQDILETLDAWQPSSSADGESNLEALLTESFFGRYRANVLVEHHEAQVAPVIYDNDPGLQSLFGGIEGASEASNIPDFMRLRAGNLLRADGGYLLLHLRDILADEQNGAHILEKLHRFLRNGTLQIEDISSSSNQGGSLISAQAAIPVFVKLVLISTREDYYELLALKPDFFDYFPIKIEFKDQVKATPENYAAYAAFIAHKIQQHHCNHFTADAVAALLQAMHRLIEDQTRLSTQFAVLEKLLLESATAASLRGADLVEIQDVKSAIQRKYARHSYIESYIRDSIIDKELIISVYGECIGQINGLTHIDLSEASFGSPVRISANCYPGSRGVLTIDREVRMSGPTHDKGVMILQSWLHTNFAPLNPLNLTASLVFEQEYSGVDGDSASCAELFALLSSLANVTIKQGIAVTGALNQHGEVLPVGGLNEKIEGYFRVCKEIGLNGEQGVLMPERNMRHLMLSDEVIDAVKAGQFKIITMNTVADGIAELTGQSLQAINSLAEAVLREFKQTLEANAPMTLSKTI
ncbi:MAG: ATP-dependent protease [Betaproteobacteria bacterium HGW-Betaproteobacteria-22]|nr:MAG: ATP-dependent protease [Betaproteobacteria bacterium HGW-Betaproteobacteria-22]